MMGRRPGNGRVYGSGGTFESNLLIVKAGSEASLRRCRPVSQIKSTGFPAYDTKLQRGIRTWRYRPYMLDGKAVPVCSAVVFVYT
jgi:hypothetical protein